MPGAAVEVIFDAGKTLAGPRWQSALSRAFGILQSYLSIAASGQRPVTDDVEDKMVVDLTAHGHDDEPPSDISP